MTEMTEQAAVRALSALAQTARLGEHAPDRMQR